MVFVSSYPFLGEYNILFERVSISFIHMKFLIKLCILFTSYEFYISPNLMYLLFFFTTKTEVFSATYPPLGEG